MNQTLMHSARSIMIQKTETCWESIPVRMQNAESHLSCDIAIGRCPYKRIVGLQATRFGMHGRMVAWSHGGVVQEICSVNQDMPHFMCPISCDELRKYWFRSSWQSYQAKYQVLRHKRSFRVEKRFMEREVLSFEFGDNETNLPETVSHQIKLLLCVSKPFIDAMGVASRAWVTTQT